MVRGHIPGAAQGVGGTFIIKARTGNSVKFVLLGYLTR